jgi:hypothetical protein
MRKTVVYGTVVVALATMANLPHMISHVGQGVLSLETWQWVYVTGVIYLAPIVAALLLWIPTLWFCEGALTYRARVSASSIERVLKIAGGGEPNRRVRLLFPIDPEGFFIPGDHDRSRLPEMERADTTNRTKVANPPERDEAAHFRHSSVASESHGAEETPELVAGYLGRIGRGTLLTPEEELSLGRRARSGYACAGPGALDRE